MRMDQSRLTVAFLNLGHFLDHLAMLIYATAVLVMTSQFGLAYQDMLPLSIGGVLSLRGGGPPAGLVSGPPGGGATQMVGFFLRCAPPGRFLAVVSPHVILGATLPPP